MTGRGPFRPHRICGPHPRIHGCLSVIYALLKSHEVIDLLIIMLGTNDGKERFVLMPPALLQAWSGSSSKKSVDRWGTKQPNILVVAPPPIGAGFHDAVMGDGCVENLPVWQSSSASSASGRACTSWTQRTASSTRWISHLTRKGHAAGGSCWQRSAGPDLSTILNAPLRSGIFSGNTIFIRAIPDRLRSVRYCIFHGRIMTANSIGWSSCKYR